MPIERDGVPSRQYLVGDALEIDFVATEDGTVFVVEQTTRTVIGTQAMEAGQALDSRPAVELEQMADRLGIEVEELRLWIYWIPERDLERARQLQELQG